MDEAFKSLIMLGSAMIYAGVLLGPWGALKDAAYNVGTGPWYLYAAAFLGIIFVLFPGLFWLSVRIGDISYRATESTEKTKLMLRVPPAKKFSICANSLIPLGLMFWVAFSLSFVLTNATYILASLSDPLGLGWNLFGTANAVWQPMLTSILAPGQTLALVGGLVWSADTAQKASSEARVSPIPVIAYCFTATLLMLWLLL